MSARQQQSKNSAQQQQEQRAADHWFAKGQYELQKTLGSNQIALLMRVIPILEELFVEDVVDGDASPPLLTRTNNNTDCHDDNYRHQEQRDDTSMAAASSNLGPDAATSASNAKYRLQHAFTQFMRAIAKAFPPLVLVIDDLQWSDAPSLDLLEALLLTEHCHQSATKNNNHNINNHDNHNLLVIGLYRSNEVNDTHLLAKMLRDLRPRAGNEFGLTEIVIGNLNVNVVHKFVQTLLSMQDNDNNDGHDDDDYTATMELALLCHARTDGNPFFLRYFLSMLYDEQVLQFNLSTLKWNWNLQEIESKTQASDNVIDLLPRKMSLLVGAQMRLLQLAACLGASFDERVLSVIWQKDNDENTKPRDGFEILLEFLKEAGYLRRQGQSQRLQLTHDKIAEAALCAIPPDKRNQFMFQVGHRLFDSLENDDLDAYLYVAVDLLNKDVLSRAKSEWPQLVELNRRAASKALTMSAFDAVAHYVREGIRLIADNGWASAYELTLDMHSMGAEAEAYLGNTKVMECYYHQVIMQERCSLLDKLRVYITYCDSIANRGRPEEASEIFMSVLKQFGHRFPRTKIGTLIQILRNIVRVKGMLKKGARTNDFR